MFGYEKLEKPRRIGIAMLEILRLRVSLEAVSLQRLTLGLAKLAAL